MLTLKTNFHELENQILPQQNLRQVLNCKELHSTP